MRKDLIITSFTFLEKTLDTYRRFFHQVFAKGLRYVITEKVELLYFNIRSNSLLSLWQINKHYVLIVISSKNIYALCDCPDFLYNTSVLMAPKNDSKNRSFCSHIIASFICLYYLLSSRTKKPQKKSPQYKCNIKEKMHSPTKLYIHLLELLEAVEDDLHDEKN